MTDYTTLDIDLLNEGLDNSRTKMDPGRLDGLAKSIRRRGVRMPLEVYALPQEDGSTRYGVSSGNRRLRATKRVCADLLAEGETELLAKRRVVPVRILTPEEAKERKYLELMENLQREDVSPLDEAIGFRWLVENHHDTPTSIAEQLGLDRTRVYNRLRLPDAPKVLLDALERGEIGATQCEMVAGIPGEAERERAAAKVLGSNFEGRVLTRDETREMIRRDFMISLKPQARPGFDLEDATLVPEAGACGGCPHRAENAPDVRVATFKGKGRGLDPMTCLNPACARAKRTETLRRLALLTQSEVLSEEACTEVFSGINGAIGADADYVPLVAIEKEMPDGWAGPTYLARNPSTGESVLMVEKSAVVDLQRATKGRKALDDEVSETIWTREGEWAEDSPYAPLADLTEEQRKDWSADVYVARNLVTGEVHDLVAKADLAKFLKKRKPAAKSSMKTTVLAMEALMEGIFSRGLEPADIDALTATELQETPAALEMFRAWLKPSAKDDLEAIDEMMDVIGAKGAGASLAYLAIAILSYGLRERGTADPSYRAFAERFGVAV